MTFRPLLGAKPDDKKSGRTVEEGLAMLRFPLFASFKLDGWRGGYEVSEFFTRKRKTFPNRNLQKLFKSIDIPSGWDGEIIVGDPFGPGVFNRTDSFCKSHYATTNLPVRFFVFDNYEAPGEFWKRLETLYDIPSLVVKLDQILITNAKELFEFEKRALSQSYEGIVLRDPQGRYKQGRSTLREQYLVKLKRFSDAEARVVGFEELFHNANSAEEDELGYTKRSSHAENLIPMGVLGSLICKLGEVELRIGTGFSATDRRHIWGHRDQYLGRLVTFKHQTSGGKSVDKGGTGLRPPYIFLRWRTEIDS